MKQEEIDILMNEINRKCKLPKHWDDFINEKSGNHHLIIKDTKNKEFYCTNCNHKFYDEKLKVKDYAECPICHKKSEIHGINYYKKEFERSVILVQRMNKQIIIRVFEIYSYFENEKSKEMKKHVIEYVRIIPGIGKFMGNNVYINQYGLLKVYHGYDNLKWYEYKRNKKFYRIFYISI